ncbi:MAG TPA: ABC transporter permease [Anaeromyxobacteraceae bacterium]|nr:ABC transporter permease [Anaeromyxobacteraceae bacterium]
MQGRPLNDLRSPLPAVPPPPSPETLPSAAPAEGAGHPAPPVFSIRSFVPVLLAIWLGPVAYLLAERFCSDRLGLPPTAARGLAALAAAALAGGLGAVAGGIGRRLAFYEITVAGALWAAATPVVLRVLPALRGGPLGLEALEAQGTLVVVLAWIGAGALAACAAFGGATLAYLAFGSGRLDPSFSWELFVARSHLRLSPRTLLALFGIVVTGLVPGLLVALVWSLLRDVKERRAYRRGELMERQRMPATLLMTLISTGAVAIGVWALIVVLSVMSGFEADLKRKILGHNAHGVVLTYGSDDFGEWRNVRDDVLGVPGVAGATPFLYSEVMLAAGENLTGAVVKGIDVDTVGSVTDLPKSISDGKLAWLKEPGAIPLPTRRGDFLEDGAAPKPEASEAKGPVLPGIVVGRELALALRVFVGDEVNVVSPFGDLGPAGPQPKSRPFRVAAIFFSGMYEYDAKFAYVDLAAGQKFFGLGDAVSGLEVKAHDADEARGVMSRILFELGGYPYRTKDWSELNRSLFSALQMEKVVMAVILGFIVLVASFTIVATLIMLVLEKAREIAVLKSMGAGVPSVMKIFVLEGVVIGGVGTIFGLLLGWGTCFLVDTVGIPLDPEVYYISNLPVLVDPAQFAFVALAAMAISFLATLYPATKAARLRPVDGLRSE